MLKPPVLKAEQLGGLHVASEFARKKEVREMDKWTKSYHDSRK
jgi:hypothetical protein